jgi:hypothetical protein
MQNLGMRFVVGCLFFWGGLHVVGFGMTENGSAVRGNPVWEILAPLFDLEWMVLKGVAFTALAAAGVVVVLLISAAVLELVSTVTAMSKKFRRNAVSYRPRAESQSELIPKPLPETAAWMPKETTPEVPYVAPVPPTREPERREVPRAPTPEELKKKAIRQIMGRK